MPNSRWASLARHANVANLLLAAFAAAASGNALAQDQKESAQEQEEIVVTGSRIARDATDASTPLAIIDAEQIKLSGNLNVDKVLGDAPQFVQATNGGATANQVPAGSAAGAAYANLRGFGPTRSLTLVNGRRFAIFGPEQVTDLNTIPTALIARTEIVTGGSSAVYGSDAITGVVNFIMKNDFEGVQLGGQYGFDSSTSTPTWNADLTLGGNFGDGRGNAVVSLNYYKREGFTRQDRGEWTELPYAEGCVTADSFSSSMLGTANGSSAANCAASGGRMGFVFGGSGDIPNGRFTIASPSAAVQTALTNAGRAGLGANGFTFNDAGTTPRLVNRPADDFNNTLYNYLQVPLERWMVNAFTHYDFTEKATGYVEFHFSNNSVDQQHTQSNVNTPVLLNVNNPYLSAGMQEVLRQLDLSEPATGSTTVSAGSATYSTTRGDNLAILNAGRRFVELPFRHNVDDHNVWRTALGFKGDLGDASEKFLRNLNYDVYYSFSRSEDSSRQEGALSRSRYQAALLSVGGESPVDIILGQNLYGEAVKAFNFHSNKVTNAEQKVIAATFGGDAVELPAGPLGFSVGAEWRSTEAEYIPDEYLRSGDVVGFNPGLPTAGKVTVKEYFGEVRVPLLAEIPAVENLTVNGGYRSSDYDLDGVGRVSTYLYGLDWRVIKSLAFRGQFQRAIRAPNIGDLYGGLQLNFQNLVDPCSNRGNAATRTPELAALCEATGVPAGQSFGAGIQPDPIVPFRSGGNVDLREESSDTRTFGIVFTPTFAENLAVTLDYFKISLDGAISQLGGGAQNTLNLCYLTLKDADSDFCRAVHRNPSTGIIQVPYTLDVLQANIGGLVTSGYDFNGRYGFDLGKSHFDINTAWTKTKEFTLTPMQAQPQNKNRCVGAYGSTCGEPIPELKGVTRVSWSFGDFGVSLRHRFVDSVTTDRYLLPKRNNAATIPALTTFTNPKLDAQNYVDLSFTYDIGDKAEIHAGVNNVFDKDPPIIAGQGGYGNTFPSTYDYAGMTMFLGFTVSSF
jgi:outer membrane receptor protein involved in Fe transport